MCQQPYSNGSAYWCQQSIKSYDGKLCPTMNIVIPDEDNPGEFYCGDSQDTPEIINVVKDSVPEQK